jgi:hypothetical protein
MSEKSSAGSVVTHRHVHSSSPKSKFTELVELGERRLFKFDSLNMYGLGRPTPEVGP